MLTALIALAAMVLPGAAAAAAEPSVQPGGGAVYVIPVKMKVERGLASFVDRALTEAEEARASLAVLEIDTPGGSLESADRIGKRIRESKVPTIAYVDGKAASAGAYLALNAGGIAMAPGATIGAAMVVDASGNAVESPKTVSFWTSEMVAAAQLNGRDPKIAEGMVDPNRTIEIKELGITKEKGQILSLSAEDARKVGYADAVAGSVDEAIRWRGADASGIVRIEPSLAEKASQALVSPGVSTILLIVGLAGILIELFVPGFGVPGITGIVAFGLYFFGQFVAGFAEAEALVVFLLGILLLVLEMFVPSFGILGILGVAGVATGIGMAAYDTGDALRSLGWAALVALALAAIFAYFFRSRGIWNRFVLREQLTAELGYVPNGPREGWLGKEGVSLSALRPAGVAEFEGDRVDVVTSGEFVEAGRRVRVTAADGTKIVVKEVQI
ncbi:nodulation protein NfeD [Cohnella sp. CBP 2801]|uniref:Nodulation protein NfeD n=2 Tax=Cohnella zeiphila TaxID=2761120 RepID=A0A7X0VTC1_9BACL|nr:nodulation protein NfeD [Cohnella zeiphila]